MHYEAQWAVIRGNIIKEVIVGAIMPQSLEVEVFKVCKLRIRVCLVGPIQAMLLLFDGLYPYYSEVNSIIMRSVHKENISLLGEKS